MSFIQIASTGRSLLPLLAYLFLMAISTSLTLPIRALFITETLGGTAFENGLTYAIPAIIAVVITPIIGDYSDKVPDRRRIITLGLAWMGLGAIVTSFVSVSWAVVLIAVLTFPVFSTINAQYFSWAGERPQPNPKQKIDTGQLRIGYVAGWVFGPAVCGALLVTGISFRGMFVYQGIALILLALLIWLFSSNPSRAKGKKVEEFRWSRFGLVDASLRNISLFVAFVLAGDILRLANLSLFVANRISTDNVDISMAYMITPIVELPAAIAFVWLAKRFKQKSVLSIGIVSAVIYFAASPFATNMNQLLVLQGLYGLIPASALTIGISYAQSCLPDRIGFATSVLFAGQSLAIVIGGVLATISGAFLDVDTAYFLPLIFCMCAGWFWWMLPNR